jgi:Mor family transcriptional regulator
MADIQFEQLPEQLAEMARTIDEVAPGAGVPAVIRLADQFRSSTIYFPNLAGIHRQQRDNAIRERFDHGERVADIAAWCGLSERQVWRILGTLP